MSYEVTATRRRPQQFSDLVGQEFVASTLTNSIKSGKIAHAYLFSGPRGCGKTSTARILAKALNCQNGPTDKPCGTCPNCLEITKGSSLDVIEIDGASNTSVENIRQIKDEVQFPPSSCKYKIYIIDEVHMLSSSAFNALLKTIEEPPEYVIFIFATTELQKVPATIKSRCQQYNFRLVAIDKVKQCLAEAAAELNIQADDEALFWIARESTGSMRDAYTLFDQVVAFSDGHITYEKIRDKLGLVGLDKLNTIFEACANGHTENVINILDDFLQGGISIEQLISNCADYLRSLLLIKNGITKEALLGNSVERYSQIVLQSWNPIQIERALSIFLQLYRDIRYSLSPRYELELTFSRLCWLSQYVSNIEVKQAIEAARALLTGAPVANTAAVSSAPVKPAMQFQNTASAMAQQDSVSMQQSSFEQPAVSQQNQQASLHDASSSSKSGFPRLAIMDDIENGTFKEPSENSGEGEQTGENPNPFLNGGSLPPEQSVKQIAVENNSFQNGQTAVITEKKALDDKLTLHIPEANLDSGAAASSVYVPTPTKDDSFSFNPDDEWSNTDEPPEEGYYPDDNVLAAQAQSSYEEYAQMDNGYVNETASTVNNGAQLEERFTTATGAILSLGQLRGQVTAAFEVNDSFVATALNKTNEWKINGDKVETTVASPFELNLLNKNIPAISGEIGKICGKPMSFEVKVKTQEVHQDAVEEELPVQVNIICDVFKGNVVTGSQQNL